jgi:hypothetical protein
MELALMPRLGGKPPSVADVAQWLAGGIRSDSGGNDTVKRKAIKNLEACLFNDLHAPSVDESE